MSHESWAIPIARVSYFWRKITCASKKLRHPRARKNMYSDPIFFCPNFVPWSFYHSVLFYEVGENGEDRTGGYRMKNSDGVHTIYSTSARLCFTFSPRHLRAEVAMCERFVFARGRHQLKFKSECARETDPARYPYTRMCTRTCNHDVAAHSPFRRKVALLYLLPVAGRCADVRMGERSNEMRGKFDSTIMYLESLGVAFRSTIRYRAKRREKKRKI